MPFGFAPMVLGDVIKDEIPSIEQFSKFQRGRVTIKKDNNIFNRMAFVDNDFMDMFTFKMLHGYKDSYEEAFVYRSYFGQGSGCPLW